MKNLKQSISYKLLFKILAIYLIVTTIITSIHLYVEYKHQKVLINDTLYTLSITTKNSFTNAIWDFNDMQLDIKVKEMINIPIIKAVEIYDNNGNILKRQYLEGYENFTDTPFKVSQVIEKKLFDKSVELGKVTLYSSKDILFDRLKVNFSFILLKVIATSILLILLFIITFKKFLITPLESITSQIDLVDVDKKIYSNLTYEYSKNDELALLKDSVNKMLKKIDEQVLKLNENEILLQQNVDDKIRELQDYVEISTDFVWEVDNNGIYIKVSNKVEDILGYKPEEMIGKSPFDFMSEEDVEKISKIFKEALVQKNPIRDLTNLNIHKDGSKVFLMTNALPILNGKELTGYRGTDKDITKEKEKDALILEQSKMAAMGEMIGNIAHQWRQPLSVISTGATGMKMQKEYNILTDEFFTETCDAINDNAQYLSKTIDDFRDFIKGERKKVLFNISDDIKSFLHLVEGTVKNNNIHIQKDIKDDISIHGYPNELIQCFINIFNNSKDVLKEIKDDRYIFISTKLIDNKVTIIFKDNGGGIPKSVLPHIFEPYFTTKHKSKGTGLGLSMTYNLIVEGMNGTIEVNNITYKFEGKEYTGAQFKIILPLE
ncbi:PAS domain-containing sensor histidine kinase [Arcobacteraceae bacterium]|nr:PAS domain-containing sensor histidine kinase [Arcobacteraceae bacterium]